MKERGMYIMKKHMTRKWYAVCGACLFLALTVCSVSAEQISDSSVIRSDQAFRENDHGGPWVCSRSVRVDLATVTIFEDPFFELYSFISNHGRQAVDVKITHVLRKPDGTREQVSWEQLTLHPGEGVEFWIMCMYLDDQYGKYSYIVTASDPTGFILDQKTVSWEREPQ